MGEIAYIDLDLNCPDKIDTKRRATIQEGKLCSYWERVW